MMREEVLTLLQRFAVEPWTTGNVEALDDVVTDDYIVQGAAGALESLKQAIRDTRTGLRDVTVTLSDVIIEDEGELEEFLRPANRLRTAGSRCCAFVTERWPKTSSSPRVLGARAARKSPRLRFVVLGLPSAPA
jgi:hypothetical protein